MVDNKVIKTITLSDGSKADLDAKYWGGLEPSSIKTINGESILGEGNIDTTKSIVELTYMELLRLRDNNKLIPGQQYKIMNYVTTTSQENTKSAGYGFGIIVTANSKNVLSEIARACYIKEFWGTYFGDAGVNLEAWKIWYCLDNDKERFSWAVDAKDGGKGVIYRMIDEWGNDCPYDFKNISFAINNSNTYQYTFSWCVKKNMLVQTIEDASIFGNNGSVINDGGGVTGVYNNVIKPYIVNGKQILNNIFFISDSNYYSGYYCGCHDNNFGINCHDNTFGNNCHSNSFGMNCYNNTFGNNCRLNIIGDSCISNNFNNGFCLNIFGEECMSNEFGDNCKSNVFEDNCYNNILGENCCNNNFGNNCHDNSFGILCQSNTFRNNCHSNILGDNCVCNFFDNDCYSNSFRQFPSDRASLLDNCSYNNFDAGCSNIMLCYYGEQCSIINYTINKGVNNKNIDILYIDSELEVDVWKTESGEVIQEYKNNYISNEDIDYVWDSIFGLEIG